MMKKTQLEETLDGSLVLALRDRRHGSHYDAPNVMIKAKAGDNVLAFVKQWAEENNVHLFVLDWDKLNPAYVNDYENGFLKDLSAQNTVMYLDNFTGIENEKRYLANSVYKNCAVGWECRYVGPNFLFAIATWYTDLPTEQFHRLDGSEKSCFGTVDFMTDEEREADGN